MRQRGKLRVYLGAAPGVGKTFKMLEEGQRRAERGSDVVIAFVETHGRVLTAKMAEGLELIPRMTREYRGVEFEEMDLDAVLERRPQVALVDELPHTNVPGGRHEKRWQDIQDLLDAGIEVISTVNIQHLESLNDVVQRITGVPQRETVPDDVVRSADQIELVDMSPESLRRRLAHGNVYAAEKIDAALGNYFRVGNLTALRELALLWVADRVDEVLQRYREEHGIGRVWEARERVVIALPGDASGEALIRRAARIAARAAGGELIAVHIARSDGLSGDTSPTALAAQRHLVESLGGSYHTIIGDDVPRALIEFAQAKNATQLVLGTSRRNRVNRFLTGRGIGETTTILSGDIDVHMVTHDSPGRRRPWYLPPNPLRQANWGSGGGWRGIAAGLVTPPLLTVLLTATQHSLGLNLTSAVLLFLSLTVAISRLGGMFSAFIAALWSSLLLNYYFIPPVHSITIAEANNAIALVVFVIVGITVASVVNLAIKQTRSAASASAEAETLNAFALAVMRGDEAITALLERFRETFSMESVCLLQRTDPDGPRLPDEIDDPARWALVASTGLDPAPSPGGADTVIDAGPGAVLALRGRTLPAADQRVLAAFAAQATAAMERRRLAKQAAAAQSLAAADKMRTALLAAVSHDLRTPLAAAKASISTLRDPELEVPADDRAELMEAAEASLDKLTRLVENLLDMSRLQAGALTPRLEPVAVAEIIPRAIDDVPAAPGRVHLEVSDPNLPDAVVDAPLAERVVANLVSNAVMHTDSPVTVTVSALAGQVEVRVIDRGPGIPEENRDLVFRPFQRLGDRDNTTGVGLGLALSRGLAEAMGGTLVPEETPGGGITMVLALPAVQPGGSGPGHDDGRHPGGHEGIVTPGTDVLTREVTG
jgi:two-component system sensor histidine kinase KdpD